MCAVATPLLVLATPLIAGAAAAQQQSSGRLGVDANDVTKDEAPEAYSRSSNGV
jgi:hypothetical protein